MSSGKIKFNNIAMTAVGATAEVAKVFIIPGRYCTALGTRFKPSPTDNETAIITIFRLFMFTSVSIFMPAEAEQSHPLTLTASERHFF